MNGTEQSKLTTLNVEKLEGDQIEIGYPKDHERVKDIERWLKYLSPGYVEYLLQFGEDPHCSSCRDSDCDNVGHGDDACPAFKFSLEW